MLTVQSGPNGPFASETLPNLKMTGLDEFPEVGRDDT